MTLRNNSFTNATIALDKSDVTLSGYGTDITIGDIFVDGATATQVDLISGQSVTI